MDKCSLFEEDPSSCNEYGHIRFFVVFQLGDDHDRTKESSDCLKHLTQQAVSIQKTLNNIYKGQKVPIPPMQVQCSVLLINRGNRKVQ